MQKGAHGNAARELAAGTGGSGNDPVANSYVNSYKKEVAKATAAESKIKG